MAIGWLSVLKLVPWRDVIGSAPAVADGAKKLWTTVARKTPAEPAPAPAPAAPVPADPPGLSPQQQALAALAAELAAVQAQTADLHAQMLACTALIKDLADQNTQLIGRIEIIRIRLLWLAAATAVLAIVATTALVAAVLR